MSDGDAGHRDDKVWFELEAAVKSVEALETLRDSDLEGANGGQSYRPILRRAWERIREHSRPRVATPPTFPAHE